MVFPEVEVNFFLLLRSVTMKALVKKAKTFLRSEDGPTATEYAVMLALIIIVALAAITLLGNKVRTIFENVESRLPAASGT